MRFLGGAVVGYVYKKTNWTKKLEGKKRQQKYLNIGRKKNPDESSLDIPRMEQEKAFTFVQ